MPQKEKKRNYPIYLNTNATEAYFEFLKILNEEKLGKGEIELAYKKDEVLEMLKKRGHNVSKSAINTFLEIAIKAQKSKPLFDLGNTIAMR